MVPYYEGEANYASVKLQKDNLIWLQKSNNDAEDAAQAEGQPRGLERPTQVFPPCTCYTSCFSVITNPCILLLLEFTCPSWLPQTLQPRNALGRGERQQVPIPSMRMTTMQPIPSLAIHKFVTLREDWLRKDTRNPCGLHHEPLLKLKTNPRHYGNRIHLTCRTKTAICPLTNLNPQLRTLQRYISIER